MHRPSRLPHAAHSSPLAERSPVPPLSRLARLFRVPLSSRSSFSPLPLAGILATLLLAATPGGVLAGEPYVKVGLPGVVVGYAHSVNDQLGLRVDAGTTGRMSRDRTESGVPYRAQMKYDRVGLFGDYRPFGGRFRLTAGLTINDASAKLNSRFDGATPVTINETTITPSAADYFRARVKIPRLTPYFGIGWGHEPRESGLGFVADIGVSVGKAKVTVDQNLTENHPALISQEDVDVETRELKDKVGKVRVLPHVAVGMSYRY
jgi:hypothetical protein